ncbi:MAG TPA: hypothetical protein VKL19_08885 [Thermoanaerobaculia bacterium]|nr:hypothetical protein [Thermoanaerobaculia bacterium]
MRRLLPLFLLLLLFATPGGQCPPPPPPPIEEQIVCEQWLQFSDGSVSVCAMEDTWSFQMNRR